ncbi:hypothetical protein [Rhizohabitans arisaemae]|uniref:hypothetical protein n=1 Tax=Rhizohabitans arisaemae TaxID=2720610 RepID=UPI0024B184BD|nr:hypothetical protein [Rhizohabitans arisaemae]
MPKPWRFAVPVVLSLTVLAGCGTTSAENSTGSSPSNSTEASADKRREIETKRADCMKLKGFKYIAYIPKPKPDVIKAQLGDYAAMKEYRAKYGFDVFAVSVFGKAGPAVNDADDNPNMQFLKEMSGAQSDAFIKAGGECHVQALNALLGTKFQSQEDIAKESDRIAEQGKRALDADPELVRLAQGYADCLKGKGHRIQDVKPSKVVTALSDVITAEFLALLKEKSGDSGQINISGDLVAVEEARPHLAREIKAALEDLECGKEFYAVYGPKHTRLITESLVSGADLMVPLGRL